MLPVFYMPLRRLALAPLALLVAACAPAKPSVSAAAVSTSPNATPGGASASSLGAFVPPVATTSSTKATLKLSSAWAHCHDSFVVASPDPRAEVARLAKGCADATKMRRVGEPFAGEQTASDKPQTFKWKAQAGHCYRAYGAGVPAIKNLDILLDDSLGVVLAQDGNDDGAPVVLDSGAVCFKVDDDAALIVSVGDGAGAFAIELWVD
jgi:hypothetical protein